jgi:hypothetical protein
MLRSAPLRKQSRGLCATKRQQRRAYQSAEPSACRACGSWQRLENSHHFPQGRYPEHRNDPRNFWIECRPCHELFEHNKAGYAQRFPEAWAAKWALMQEVDAQAAAFFEMKNPTLFI